MTAALCDAQCHEHLQSVPQLSAPRAVSAAQGQTTRLLARLRRVRPGHGLFHAGLGPTIRQRALRQEALTIGAQGGLYYRSRQINHYLSRVAPDLNRIFSFAPLMIHGSVLPPIIARVSPVSHLDAGGLSLVQVRAVYRILTPARLVSVTPTWRTRLDMPLRKPRPQDIPLALLPHSATERAMWARTVDRGWVAGIRQADFLFRERVRRLKRSVLGRLLFLRLANAGFVSVPRLAQGRYGIQVGAQVLRDGVRLFRVTAPARFLATPGWRAPVVFARQSRGGASHD